MKDKLIIEKLKEIIFHIVVQDCDYKDLAKELQLTNCNECKRFGKELQSLESQSEKSEPEKTDDFYSFVKTIDADKVYPVRYWIDQRGNKHYEWKLLPGEDLTENQIFELYNFARQFSAQSVKETEETILVDDPNYPNMGRRITKQEYESQFKNATPPSDKVTVTDEEIEKEFPTDLKTILEDCDYPIRFNAEQGQHIDNIQYNNGNRQEGAKWMRDHLHKQE